MRKRQLLFILFVTAYLLCLFMAWKVHAQYPPIPNNYCQITGTVSSLVQATGYAYANQGVTFNTQASQNSYLPGCSSQIPIAPSSMTYQTDSNGVLPPDAASGGPVLLQQGAHVNMIIGNGPPVPLIVPCQSTAGLFELMTSQTTFDPVVSSVNVQGPQYAGNTVTNPGDGQIGPATINSPASFSQTQITNAAVDVGTYGNVQQVVMAGNVVIALTNFQSGANFVVDTTENATGGFTPTFTVPTGWTLQWPSGGSQPPTPSTSANVHLLWTFVASNGTQLVGSVALAGGSGNAFPLTASANFNNYSGYNVNSIVLAPLPPPSGVSTSSTCSGTCTTTYTYEVTCLGDLGTESSVSNQVTTNNANVLSATNKIVIGWTAEPACHGGYNVYGRMSGALGLLTTVATTSYTDTGVATPAAAPPTLNSTGSINSSGSVLIHNQLNSVVVAIVNALTGQSADIFNVDLNGVPMFRITSTGGLVQIGTATIEELLTANSGAAVNGGLSVTGATAINALGTPGAPNIVSGFSSGTTDYYFCVGTDAFGKQTIPSSGTGTTSNNGTMSCGGQTGAVGYSLLRTASITVPSTPGNYLIGTCATTSGVLCNVSDAATSPGAFTPQTLDQTNTITVNGATSGAVKIQPQMATGTWNFNLPITAGTAGQVLKSAAGGTAPMTWGDTEWALSTGAYTWGALATGAPQLVMTTTAVSSGHFTKLTCVNLTGGTCSGNAPTFQVFNATSALQDATTVTCSTTQQPSIGQGTQASPTLAYAAGDLIGIDISTLGTTCTAPVFTVTAQLKDD